MAGGGVVGGGNAGGGVSGGGMRDLDLDNLGCVVSDEIHYINDHDRGSVWEETPSPGAIGREPRAAARKKAASPRCAVALVPRGQRDGAPHLGDGGGDAAQGVREHKEPLRPA